MARIYTIPNIITFVRIILIPIILYLLFSDNSNVVLIAGLLFIVSSISDYFDGYLARTLNQSSKLGTLLDPIADKLLVVITIFLLAGSLDSTIFIMSSLIIISREFLVIAIRQRLAELKTNASLKVNNLGRIKTGFQMSALVFLLHSNIEFAYINLHIIGIILPLIAAILTVLSFIYYVRNAWDDILS